MPENIELAGLDLIVTAGASIIGGQENATLNWEANANEVNTKTNGGWREALTGLIGWNIAVGGLWYEGAPEAAATRGFGSSLGLRAVGGGSYDLLAALAEITFTLQMETREVSNQDHAGYRVVRPNIRGCTIDVTADYVDPNATSNAALQTLLSAFENRDDVEFQYSFGEEGSSFSGLAVPVPQSLQAPNGDDAQVQFQLQTQGPVANALAGVDAGLVALFDAFFTDPPTELAVELGVDRAQDGDYDEGYDKYSGNCYATELVITNPADGPIQTSGTLTGSSPLTREPVPAPV